MQARLRLMWARVRDSLWFLPGVLTVLASLLAFGLTAAERRGWIGAGLTGSWIFGGGVEGARGVLSTIAGGLITVTGVVFSVTIVALQLASSQFTPRVLRNFTADRANQTVLGVFIGTFTYTLLVLRTVHSGTGAQEPFVPRIAVAVAVALVLVSIGFLIFFINHAARSIQVSAILERVTKETLGNVYRLFPEAVGRAERIDPADTHPPGTQAGRVPAGAAGYLQAVDSASIFRLGERRSLAIRMEPYVGDFVLPGETLARVWPAEAMDDKTEDAIRTAFVLGPERTPEQDPEFGIIEISDIAVKALSPGINDPTTALRCIDRLAEILLALGTRSPPRDERTREGKVHFLARHLTFDRAVGLAYDQIRHYGADNPMIARKLLSAMLRLADLVPPERARLLHTHAEVVLRAARDRLQESSDLQGVETLASRLKVCSPEGV